MTSTESSVPDLRILLLIYPGFNSLDMIGPLDAICSAGNAGKTVVSTVAAATPLTRSFEDLTYHRDVSFADLLASSPTDDATTPITPLAAYDLLLVPGAGKADIEAARATDLVTVVRAYAATATAAKPATADRWLMSVCTGSIFLGAAGVLAGKTATTHHRHLDYLVEVCRNTHVGKGGAETTVVRKRFVDAGRTEGGMRLLTAGGVSCGIDGGLWFVAQRFGMEAARICAGVMDYRWELGEVDATEGFVLP